MAVKDCASVPGTLTRGERQPLVQAGENEAVLDLRKLWQKVVRTSCSRAIEELIGGQVVGFMSDEHIDPDIAAGVLMLEPVGADPVAQAAIAVVDRAPG
jgi:uncharacterized protein YbcI